MFKCFFFLSLTKSTLNRVSPHSQLSTARSASSCSPRAIRRSVDRPPFGSFAPGEFAIANQGPLLALGGAENHFGNAISARDRRESSSKSEFPNYNCGVAP